MVVAGGITALQVAANAYVTVLGKPETASSRLNLAQAFNSFGTTIGPYLGGLFILSANPKTAETLNQMSLEALKAYRIHEPLPSRCHTSSSVLPWCFLPPTLPCRSTDRKRNIRNVGGKKAPGQDR